MEIVFPLIRVNGWGFVSDLTCEVGLRSVLILGQPGTIKMPGGSGVGTWCVKRDELLDLCLNFRSRYSGRAIAPVEEVLRSVAGDWCVGPRPR